MLLGFKGILVTLYKKPLIILSLYTFRIFRSLGILNSSMLDIFTMLWNSCEMLVYTGNT